MRLFQVDAFTPRRYSGNPAMVVLGAESQSEETLTQIAREFAHAETAFVLPATEEDHDIGVRFFNARKEAAFVGHATLAVHHVLLTLGSRGYGAYRQKSKQGIMPVTIASGGANTGGAEGAVIEFRQGAAALDAPMALNDALRVAQALGLPGELLHQSLPAVVARKGSTRLLLPVASSASLTLIKPSFASLVDLGAEFGIEGFFPFAIEREAEQVRTRSRMFCPALGIPEDPVSGNAHAMLATYLWQQRDLRPFVAQFTGLQGEYMARPGEVSVRLEVEHGELAAAHIGGHAVIVSEGTLT